MAKLHQNVTFSNLSFCYCSFNKNLIFFAEAKSFYMQSKLKRPAFISSIEFHYVWEQLIQLKRCMLSCLFELSSYSELKRALKIYELFKSIYFCQRAFMLLKVNIKQWCTHINNDLFVPCLDVQNDDESSTVINS